MRGKARLGSAVSGKAVHGSEWNGFYATRRPLVKSGSGRNGISCKRCSGLAGGMPVRSQIRASITPLLAAASTESRVTPHRHM